MITCGVRTGVYGDPVGKAKGKSRRFPFSIILPESDEK